MGAYRIELVSGERYDRIFHWKSIAPPVALPMTGYQALMSIFQGHDLKWSTALPTTGLVLVQEPASETGRLDLTIHSVLTAAMLLPYGPKVSYGYRIDLIDQGLADNVIPLLYGDVVVSPRMGA